MSKLSVIMPVYNETRVELQQSINSILNQTFTNLNLVIIDDNPNSSKLREYLKNKQLKDSRIKLIFNKRNIGPAKSRNEGIRKSNSALIGLMDADDVSKSNRFNTQIQFMKKYNLDFVFPNKFNIIKSKLDKSDTIFNHKIIDQQYLKHIFAYYYNFSIHSGWLVKRQVYDDLNGYRNTIIEDFDFILRALIKNYRLGYEPDTLIYYRVRNSGISRSNTLNQFITTLILQHYVKKYRYKYIVSLSTINHQLRKYVTNYSLNHFNLFILAKNNLKKKFSIINLVKFIIRTLTSINAIMFMISTKFLIPYDKRKVEHHIKYD